MKGKLILEDGSVFFGELLNNIKASGEVVFNTGVVGYQELLTDPSYCRQIVTMTYPLIGNVGVAEEFMQSRKAFVNGLVIGELCDEGSNYHMENSLESFLLKQGIPCLYNVDTRAITRKIRSAGSMKGVIVAEDSTKAEADELFNIPLRHDMVEEVTTPEAYVIENDGPNVVVLDLGIKKKLITPLSDLGCKLTVVPATASYDEIMGYKPAGVVISNGPGSAEDIAPIVEMVKKLADAKMPMFGFDLGHLVLAAVFGAKSCKMKFGHHGANQPVKILETGKVNITAQGHNFALDAKSFDGLPLKITHVSLNDDTVEGMEHKELPIFSVQYHPEADLYKRFVAMLKKGE